MTKQSDWTDLNTVACKQNLGLETIPYLGKVISNSTKKYVTMYKKKEYMKEL